MGGRRSLLPVGVLLIPRATHFGHGRSDIGANTFCVANTALQVDGQLQ